MIEKDINVLKEKIQTINPEFSDELLELLSEFLMKSIGNKLVKELHGR